MKEKKDRKGKDEIIRTEGKQKCCVRNKYRRIVIRGTDDFCRGSGKGEYNRLKVLFTSEGTFHITI